MTRKPRSLNEPEIKLYTVIFQIQIDGTSARDAAAHLLEWFRDEEPGTWTFDVSENVEIPDITESARMRNQFISVEVD